MCVCVGRVTVCVCTVIGLSVKCKGLCKLDVWKLCSDNTVKWLIKL